MSSKLDNIGVGQVAVKLNGEPLLMPGSPTSQQRGTKHENKTVGQFSIKVSREHSKTNSA